MRINDNHVNGAAVLVLGATMLTALALRVEGAKEICLGLGGGLVGFLTRGAVDLVKDHFSPAVEPAAQP